MTIQQLLQSAHCPLSADEIRHATGLSIEAVYQELVHLEAKRAARVVNEHSGFPGWIAEGV